MKLQITKKEDVLKKLEELKSYNGLNENSDCLYIITWKGCKEVMSKKEIAFKFYNSNRENVNVNYKKSTANDIIDFMMQSISLEGEVAFEKIENVIADISNDKYDCDDYDFIINCKYL